MFYDSFLSPSNGTFCLHENTDLLRKQTNKQHLFQTFLWKETLKVVAAAAPRAPWPRSHLPQITPAPAWLTSASSLFVRLPCPPPNIPLTCQMLLAAPTQRSTAQQDGALISHLTEWEYNQSTGLIDTVKFFSYRDYVVAEAVRTK